MLLFVDEIYREIDELEEYAAMIKEKFDQGREASELLLDARFLDRRSDDLRAMLPTGLDAGNLARHSSFMVHYLEQNKILSCSGDIADIVDHDLPAIRTAIREWSHNLEYVDEKLKQAISPLIRTQQFDSAIRKAFVILKTRLCDKFNLDHADDGARLINQIFGQANTLLPELDDGVRQAYRDYFSGLFGLLRNKFAHNNTEPSLSELDTVISGINYCLQVIGDFRNAAVIVPKSEN